MAKIVYSPGHLLTASDVNGFVQEGYNDADTLNGKSWGSPAPIGDETPDTGAFTGLSATGDTVFGYGGVIASVEARSAAASGGVGFSQYLFGSADAPGRGHLSYSHQTDALSFGVAAATKMTLSAGGLAVAGALSASGALTTAAIKEDAAGNVGIGVTPSAWISYRAAIDVGGGISIVGGRVITQFANNYYVDSSGVSRYKATGSAQFMLFPQDGGVQWHTSSYGTADAPSYFTQSLAFGLGTTLALEGATSAAGTGIAFPATQLASSNPNTLDDYEEGTWTPSLGATTYALQIGSYTKKGREVTVHATIEVAELGAGRTNVISGLPFVPDSSGHLYPASIGYFSNCVPAINFIAGGADNNNTITLYFTTAPGATLIADVLFQNNTRLDLSLTYNTP